MRLEVKIYNEKIKEMRLNKYLSEIGIFSRREADKLIEKKLIHINDKIANLGDRIKDKDSIFINQEETIKKYFIYYKPYGEETTFKIFQEIRYEPIIRLEKESEGLLLYSNDFRIIESLLNPDNNIEIEYLVTTKEKSTPRVKTILERGIKTQEEEYAPVRLVTLDDENRQILQIILTEDKKHGIRRMLNALNLTILSMKRIRFDFLTLSRLKPGSFKELTDLEINKLLKKLRINN